MTIEEMKDYFSHRELGLQEAAGEYAILVPLVQWEGQRCLLFETRADTLVGHQPGEVCFPGGRREHGETPRETALRETWEEIGIPPEEIRVLAPLDRPRVRALAQEFGCAPLTAAVLAARGIDTVRAASAYLST